MRNAWNTLRKLKDESSRIAKYQMLYLLYPFLETPHHPIPASTRSSDKNINSCQEVHYDGGYSCYRYIETHPKYVLCEKNWQNFKIITNDRTVFRREFACSDFSKILYR